MELRGNFENFARASARGELALPGGLILAVGRDSGTEREKGQREEEKEETQSPGAAKTQVVTAVRRAERAADGRAEVRGDVGEPAATAVDAPCAVLRFMRVSVIASLGPFPDVASHIFHTRGRITLGLRAHRPS